MGDLKAKVYCMSTKSEVVPTARFLSYVAQQYKVNTSFYSSAYQAPDLP